MAVERQDSIPLENSSAGMRGLLVLPEGEPPRGGWPGVVAIHDALGFSADIRRIARRFADSGYAALAPALYDGAGPPVLCVVSTFRDMSRGSGPAFERIDAARRFLGEQPEVDAERIGITGFCMGGGFAIFYAARGSVKVAAPFYGLTPENPDALRQVCPVFAGFGELDRQFVDHGRRLKEHLEKLGIAHDVRIYPDAGHSYMNDHGQSPLARLGRHLPMHAAYHESAAEDSWQGMLAFFARHL